MRIAFHHSDKPREVELARAFGAGVMAHGDQFEPRRLGRGPIGDCDLAVMVGVKSVELWQASRAAGARTLMMDKGYLRHRAHGRTWEYWRVALDAHQPKPEMLGARMPGDRARAAGFGFLKWRKSRPEWPIIIAGSSAKYHAFAGLPEPTEYVAGLVERLQRLARRRPIIYRPKPSWREAVPIEGTRFSPGHENFGALLGQAHCLVTHGSNACLDAMIAGVPSVVLGPAVLGPISSRELAEIERPRLATKAERSQLLANLAYHQWTEPEMRHGLAWEAIRSWL